MKVLLVDDDYLTLEGLSQLLHWDQFGGILTGTACNGAAALELIRKEIPDVVITDIKMPKMDGLELSRYLYENHPNVHIILLSGHSEFEYAQNALRYHAVDYILKPINSKKIQELENRLFVISQKLDQEQTEYSQLYNEHLRQQVLDALRKGNMAKIGDLMVSDKVLSALKNDSHDTLGIQLLNYLFVYQAEIGKDRPCLSQVRQQTMEQYWKLDSADKRLSFLCRQYYDLMEYAQNRKTEYSEPIVNYCIQTIQENFSDSACNISQIADSLNLTLPYLSTVFKRVTGMNISNYLAEHRFRHAQKLLRDLSIPIKEVCRQSGFEDQRYFAKSFKKFSGMTPSEYRNLYCH